MMKILVTGKSGQLTQSLAALQTCDGDTISCLGRPDLDLTVPQTLEKTLKDTGPDLVINATAYTGVDRAETETRQAYAINRDGAGHVARHCALNRIPLVHISTDYVFDGLKQRAYTETDAVAPQGVYGQSKLEGEQQVRDYCPDHIIVRTAWLYSPFGQNFVKTMLRLATDRDTVDVVSDQTGSPTHAPHLATALYAISREITSGNAIPRGVYHAAGSGTTSWATLAEEVFACSKKYAGPVARVNPIPASSYPSLANRPANSQLDCTRLADRFNISLPGWQQGVDSCVKSLLLGRTGYKILEGMS